ncbi:MAG: hypothetical protein ACFFBD_06135, partial [Candidatus Hodarchaeota archaeon]
MKIRDLHQKKYTGFSIHSMMRKAEYRQIILEKLEPLIRGNHTQKERVLDSLALRGKVLLTGPTGEAKTLFARLLLENIAGILNRYKYRIQSCPFNEDAGYLIRVLTLVKDTANLNYAENLLHGIDILNSLCPHCHNLIEEHLKNINPSLSLYLNQELKEQILEQPEEFIRLFGEIRADRIQVNMIQLDPRNDPESLYMLLAGVENLEKLLSSSTETTFDMGTHKPGALSQGLIVVNEIQRLPGGLLESLMGFLEDPRGIKYSIAGRPVYIDGAIVFTSNASLKNFGEEMQPIINRIPEVLWPARGFNDRKNLIQDLFSEHLLMKDETLAYNTTVLQDESREKTGYISALAIDFLSILTNMTIPAPLFEDRDRSAFYDALDQIHDPEDQPHLDTRTLFGIIGEIVLKNSLGNKFPIISLEDCRQTILRVQNSQMVNDAWFQVEQQLQALILDKTDPELATKMEGIRRDRRRLKSTLNPERLKDLILKKEGEQLSGFDSETIEIILEKLQE